MSLSFIPPPMFKYRTVLYSKKTSKSKQAYKQTSKYSFAYLFILKCTP